jgi:hypothetical protein
MTDDPDEVHEAFVAALQSVVDRLDEATEAIERVARRVEDLEARIRLKKDK